MKDLVCGGLKKEQVKAIIKIAKSKQLNNRPLLQGIIYNAEHKSACVTDGYFAVVWDLHNVAEDFLPEQNCKIDYTKLNAWQVNATSGSLFSWGDLKDMAEPQGNIPDIHKILVDIKGTDENALINPAILTKALSVLDLKTMDLYCEFPLAVNSVDLNGTPAFMGKSENGLFPITVIIMGMKGNK